MATRIGLLCLLVVSMGCGQSRHDLVPEFEKAKWQTIIASTKEPGSRITVSGTVYADDGITPVAEARIYLYHTDKKGYYSKNGVDESKPRLKGWIKTNTSGQYRYETIRPGSYPSGGVPAHVHYVITKAGFKDKRLELRFSDDPLIRQSEKERSVRAGKFGWVRSPDDDSDESAAYTMDIRLVKK